VLHDPQLLDALEQFRSSPWRGTVYRHVLGPYAPDLANVRGARWNPPEVSALYVSLEEETAKAEGARVLEVQSVPPRVKRSIYELDVELERVLDLTTGTALAGVGLTDDDLQSDSFLACQRVGGAVAWLGHDGLLVPSARAAGGINLVIYTSNQASESEISSRRHWEIQG
jgi:RES domain-containing protein